MAHQVFTHDAPGANPEVPLGTDPEVPFGTTRVSHR
jgi:hypothetical protein